MFLKCRYTLYSTTDQFVLAYYKLIKIKLKRWFKYQHSIIVVSKKKKKMFCYMYTTWSLCRTTDILFMQKWIILYVLYLPHIYGREHEKWRCPSCTKRQICWWRWYPNHKFILFFEISNYYYNKGIILSVFFCIVRLILFL